MNTLLCDRGCIVTGRCTGNCEEPLKVAASELNNLVMCVECCGDGKETCHNPDHGFINALSFHDIGRLGCPVCGHDELHKVKNGGDCELCGGTGKTTEEVGRQFCESMDYDYEDIQDTHAT